MIQVDLAYEALRRVARGLVADVHTLPIATRSVDAVICVGSVLNYVSLPDAISEISRVCRSGAIILLEYERSMAASFHGTGLYGQDVAQRVCQFCKTDHTLWFYSDAYFDAALRSHGNVIAADGFFHVASSIGMQIGLDINAAAVLSACDRFFPWPRKFAANRWVLGIAAGNRSDVD